MVCIWWTLRGLRAHLRAQPAGRDHHDRRRPVGWRDGPGRPTAPTKPRRGEVGPHRLRPPRPRTDRRRRREGDRPRGRVLRRRRRAPGRLPVPDHRRASAATARRRQTGRPSRASASATPPNAPGRSVLAIAVIASATFILISVDAFRRGDIDRDRSPLRHRRLPAARRPAAAARPRSQLPRRPRRARPRIAGRTSRSSRSACCRATMRAA